MLKRSDVDGRARGHVRVLETGNGPPVLFVHGAGMTAGVWAPLLACLPQERSICVDLPGCGLTDPADHRGVGLRVHAQSFLTAVLDALELWAVPVVANWLGAPYHGPPRFAWTLPVAKCYHLAMPVNMHIRDLDEPTHQELVRRADAAGMSLRSYVIEVLHRHAALPTLDDWLDDVRGEPPLPSEGPDSVTLVEEGREDSDVA